LIYRVAGKVFSKVAKPPSVFKVATGQAEKAALERQVENLHKLIGEQAGRSRTSC
jgi:hypothetical protein